MRWVCACTVAADNKHAARLKDLLRNERVERAKQIVLYMPLPPTLVF